MVSIYYERAQFVQIQKNEIFQLSFTALFPTKSSWNSIIFDVITYPFAGAHSKMVNGNHFINHFIKINPWERIGWKCAFVMITAIFPIFLWTDCMSSVHDPYPYLNGNETSAFHPRKIILNAEMSI